MNIHRHQAAAVIKAFDIVGNTRSEPPDKAFIKTHPFLLAANILVGLFVSAITAFG
jgi:hypothetical protein